MLDRRIFLTAGVADRDGISDNNLQFAAFEQLFLVGSPSPAVGKIFRNDGGNLSYVHHHLRDVGDAVLFGNLLHVPDDVEYYSEFVHQSFFFKSIFAPRLIA